MSKPVVVWAMLAVISSFLLACFITSGQPLLHHSRVECVMNTK